MRRHPGARARRLATVSSAALTLVVLAFSVAGCTGDDGEPDAAATSPSQAMPSDDGAVFEVATVTRVGKVTGKLSREARASVVDRVTPVVERYVAAAYGGSYPRSSFGDALADFTPVAQQQARRDLDLLTNRPIGAEVDDVVPLTSRVDLDILGVQGHAAGVTARFTLRFRTEGDGPAGGQHVRVDGRLLLTRGDSGWKVFAYHVSKGVS